jgi:citrate lyase subunit beta/citryl-CoA lyase
MLVKGAKLPADEVFIDLEDAVAPEEKTDATRQQVVDALVEQNWLAETKAVRINDLSSRWWLRDLVYVVERAAEVIDCIMIPKVEHASHVHAVHHVLGQLEQELGLRRRIGIEVQIESPRGIVEIDRIATASTRIETLIFGPGDYAAAARIPQLTVGALEPAYPGERWHYVQSVIATTAHAYGLDAIDGPYAQIRDHDGFAEVARRAFLLGFDGKWALHPDQIAVCNATFVPTQEEYERAERILTCYRQATEHDGLGALMFEGEMIDEASRKMAEHLAARGRAAGMAVA